ncbi:MAG: 5-oxoprolinase subunit PxpB [Flammeovirgaceae bacterium]
MTIYPVNECTIAVKVGEGLDETVNEKAHALYHRLKQDPLWSDVIPAYNTVTVVYDPWALRQVHPSASAFAMSLLQQAIDQLSYIPRQPARLLNIPVCYDASFGLDLTQLSIDRQISVDQIITLHTEKTYRVCMIGFLPGFAYMGKVDSRIASPRLMKPRTLVPAGSVGIAGEQTGIYPFDSPGGWNIIGRTPVLMFEKEKSEPVFFQPGDHVKFFPITKAEWEAFDLPEFLSKL